MGEDTETDMRSQLVVMYKEQAEVNVSSLSLGDQSYIMDLANQRHFREERRREEAMEDALELYQIAVEEGAPEGVELFQILMAKTLKELNEENREKDRLQDEWLEAALQEETERQQRCGGLNVSNHTLSKSNHSRGDLTTSVCVPPSIYNGCRPTLLMRQSSNFRMLELDQKIHDEEKKILQKKIKKAERLIKEIVREKGDAGAKATRKYKDLQKKIKEYRATLNKAEQDDLKISRHSKSVMYDWGNVDLDEKVEYEQDDDESSFMSEKKTDGSKKSSRFSEGDLEWAKQVVANLNLDVEENLVEEPTVKYVSLDTEEQKQRRPPNKNMSFSTVMATTQRISGHELRTKSKLGSQTHIPLHQLAVTKEEDDAEDSGTAFVSTGSTHTESTPPQLDLAPLHSPGKRKSPSWKIADAIKISPIKHLVTDSNVRKPICAPPLSDNAPTREECSKCVDGASHSPEGVTLYTLEDFKQGRVSDIEMADWELFLADDEFVRHFGMTRAAFDKLPKWKKQSTKRQLRTW